MAVTPGLRPRLTFFPVVNIVVANMIGAGIFTTSGLLLQEVSHPYLMLLLWLAGGVIALCGALSYSELGAAMPEAGGEYTFLTRLYHPLLGFLSGWVSLLVGFSAPIAASAIGFSEYLFRLAPSSTATTTEILWLKKGLALTVIVGFTLIHLRGLELGARVQNLLTLLKVGLILALIALGFAIGRGHLQFTLETPSPFPSTKKIGLGLMWVMFAYSGWNAATYIGSEIRRPGRVIPQALLVGTGVVTLLYLGLNLLFLFAVPAEELKGVISVGGLAAAALFGRPAELFISLLIAFALFSSLSAFIILGPRVYYAMARDGVFFASFARVHPKTEVPTHSILLQGFLAALLVVTGTFDQILTYMGFALGIFPLFAVAGVFRLRRQHQSVRLPGFPVVQLVYLAAGTSMLVLAYLERPLESSVAVLTVLAGVPAYWYFRAQRKDEKE